MPIPPRSLTAEMGQMLGFDASILCRSPIELHSGSMTICSFLVIGLSKGEKPVGYIAIHHGIGDKRRTTENLKKLSRRFDFDSYKVLEGGRALSAAHRHKSPVYGVPEDTVTASNDGEVLYVKIPYVDEFSVVEGEDRDSSVELEEIVIDALGKEKIPGDIISHLRRMNMWERALHRIQVGSDVRVVFKTEISTNRE